MSRDDANALAAALMYALPPEVALGMLMAACWRLYWQDRAQMLRWN